MRAGEYLAHLQSLGIVSGFSLSGDPEISFVTNRASDVKAGSIFCAICGSKFDGHDFLPDAKKNGAAVCVVHAEKYTGSPDTIAVTDSFYAWGALCEKMHNIPAKSFHLYGITGTNGKTTSAILLHYFLIAAQRKCGILTTVFTDICDGIKKESASTMPDAASLQMLFSGLRNNGAQDLVMECSSHGLFQSRSGSAKYSGAVFTNLTGDHLDYHKTMEAYYQAKKKLFTTFAAPGMPAVINIDDPYGKRLYDELTGQNIKRISLSAQDSGADCFFTVQSANADGTVFRLWGQDLQTALTGLHNVYNLAGILALADAIGVPKTVLISAVAHAPAAPGRLERFALPSGAAAFVDYAHTDDAILRVTSSLNELRKQTGGHLITVFGCGGDRDKTKRPRMLAAARKFSDRIIVTSDNPRTEKPEDIIADILSGSQPDPAIQVIPDRAEAIAAAIRTAKKNDLILIAGKGHENYQEINGIRHHFDDREEVGKLSVLSE